MITVSSQLEWEELISFMSGKSVMKVFVSFELLECKSVGKKRVKKNWEMSDMNMEAKYRQESRRMFKSVVNEINQLRKDKGVEGESDEAIPELDLDFNQSFWELYQWSVYYLSSQEMKHNLMGRDLAIRMVEMNPQNHNSKIIALYNLACAESLLGNIDEALTALEKAIDAGFNESLKMKNEKHFANIKNTVWFSKLIEKIHGNLFPNQFSSNESKVEQGEKLERSNDTNVLEMLQECNIQEKMDYLKDKFLMTLPTFLNKSFLQDMLFECEGDVERVVSLINSTMFT